MRELQLVRAGHLEWVEREAPVIQEPRDAVVRPFVAGRCDGDTLPISRRASRALRLGMHLALVDPIVGDVCGPAPFKGPYAIGHECVGEVIDVGPEVTGLQRGDAVIVPWSVSCGSCVECARGLTAKCATTRAGALAAFGFGPASGPWGGMVADLVRIPFADHMLVRVPDGVDPLRVAAASDNLADAWRCVIPPFRSRPGGRVLILGGAAQSVGLYAAGLAVCHRVEVDYVDRRVERLDIAEKLGARVHRAKKGRRTAADVPRRDYDIAVEGTATAAGVAVPWGPWPQVASGSRSVSTCRPARRFRSCTCTSTTPRSRSGSRMSVRFCRTCWISLPAATSRLNSSPPRPRTGRMPPTPTRRVPPNWCCTVRDCMRLRETRYSNGGPHDHRCVDAASDDAVLGPRHLRVTAPVDWGRHT